MNTRPSAREKVVFVVALLSSIIGIITASYRGREWLLILLGLAVAAYFLWRWILRSKEDKQARGSPLLNPMSSASIAEPAAQRLSEVQRCRRDALGLAAFILVRWEQLANGIWAKSYLFRLCASKTRPPLSGGSLTGTYITAYAILCAQDDRHDLRLFTRSLATINGLRSSNGTYRRIKRPSTGGGEQFELESPRHAAGALLTRLLLGASDDVDAKTADWLCDQPHSGPFDAAFVARALRAWPQQSAQTNSRVSILLETLLPAIDQTPIEYWRHSNAPVSDNTYQWCVIWTFLPFLRDRALRPDLVNDLETATRRMINEFLTLVPQSHALLPSGYDDNNVPRGESVLGTSIALSVSVVCGWREEFHYLVDKLLYPRSYELITLPTVSRTGDLGVEMYLSWGALLHTTALLGYRLQDDQIERVRHVIGKWHQPPTAGALDDASLRSRFDGLPPECIQETLRAAQAVQDLYSRVDEDLRV